MASIKAGRPAAPVNEKKRRGTFKKSRDNAAHPPVQPVKDLPQAPEHLDEIGKNFYLRLAAHARKMKTLSEQDEIMLEMAAQAYSNFMHCQAVVRESGYVYSNPTKFGTMFRGRPEVAMMMQLWKQVEASLTHFGLSPATREKVKQIGAGSEQLSMFDVLNGKVVTMHPKAAGHE